MTPPATMSREALLKAKLTALVAHHWGREAVTAAVAFPSGAGMPPTAAGGPAYVLVDGATHRSLGGVLAWALRHSDPKHPAGEIHLLADTSDETAAWLSRRAQPFALPVTVWRVIPPDVRKVAPAGFFPPPELPAEAAPFADVLRAAGAEPVVEFGVLTGEVLGLEVARVVVDDDGPRLEVGVGRQDRAARREVHADRDTRIQLADVVALVRRFRTPAGSAHLANSLAGERWLRRVLVARPDLVGAAWLAPVPPAVPRGDLRTPEAALAAGVGQDDEAVVVAASRGIDLDLVPAAADGWRGARLEGARLILALVEADAHPRTRQLASLLTQPAEVATVPADWKGLAGTL